MLGLECASKLVRKLTILPGTFLILLQAGFLESVDVADVHGALAGLKGISEAYRAQGGEDSAIDRQKVRIMFSIRPPVDHPSDICLYCDYAPRCHFGTT